MGASGFKLVSIGKLMLMCEESGKGPVRAIVRKDEMKSKKMGQTEPTINNAGTNCFHGIDTEGFLSDLNLGGHLLFPKHCAS